MTASTSLGGVPATARASRMLRPAGSSARGRRVRRSIWLFALTFAILVVVNFVLPRLLPGEPIQAQFDSSSLGYVEDETARAQAEDYYGLDEPLAEQFVTYVGQLARGDLGTSIRYSVPVTELIADRLPWTLLLAMTALVVSVAVGVPAGIHSAWRRGRASDRTMLALFLGSRNLPAFFVGSLLLLLFSVKLGWFPLAGAKTPFTDMSAPARVLDVLWHLVLPATTLALALTGTKYLLMRNSMVSELGKDYLLLARAKGLSIRRQKYGYAARNAMLPVVTQMVLQVGLLVTGVIFVERVFDYPGMGRLIYDAISFRDYPLLSGVFLVTSAAVLLANLALDVMYVKLDPRTEER
jgi:peptide/nickel transport system permease protein